MKCIALGGDRYREILSTSLEVSEKIGLFIIWVNGSGGELSVLGKTIIYTTLNGVLFFLLQICEYGLAPQGILF